MTHPAQNSYQAAGGVVVKGGRVLVLLRPSRNEVRLPKGHIEPGETTQETALRETREETGYRRLVLLKALGEQQIEFDYQGVHVQRMEYFYLFRLDQPTSRRKNGEAQFIPEWLSWEEAIERISFEGEREWLRRAHQAYLSLKE